MPQRDTPAGSISLTGIRFARSRTSPGPSGTRAAPGMVSGETRRGFREPKSAPGGAEMESHRSNFRCILQQRCVCVLCFPVLRGFLECSYFKFGFQSSFCSHFNYNSDFQAFFRYSRSLKGVGAWGRRPLESAPPGSGVWVGRRGTGLRSGS